jgi:hypothetical protein
MARFAADRHSFLYDRPRSVVSIQQGRQILEELIQAFLALAPQRAQKFPEAFVPQFEQTIGRLHACALYRLFLQ